MLSSAVILRLSALCALLASAAFATGVPSLSFEELTDQSDAVVSGQVTRSWSAWDSAHQFIWTHYEIAVSGTHKGPASMSVVVSELGGVVGGIGQSVAGSVSYQNGDTVVAFLRRMPNGFTRTTGWGQGKYVVNGGRIHAAAAGTTSRSLDGLTVVELVARVAARVRVQRLEGAK